MAATTISEPAAIEDDELYEVIDGRRVRTPPIGIFAVWIASELHSALSHFVKTHHLGRSLTEALFHLPAPADRDRRPDVAFVSYERWPKSRSIPHDDNAWNVVPNMATEVVSPTDSAEELRRKIGDYFRAGVQAVWVVYPSQSEIYVYSSPTDITVVTKTDILDGRVVVPGFRLPLAELFTDPEPEQNGKD